MYVGYQSILEIVMSVHKKLCIFLLVSRTLNGSLSNSVDN